MLPSGASSAELRLQYLLKPVTLPLRPVTGVELFFWGGTVENKRFPTYLSLFIWLAFLSQPSLVSAWSVWDTAETIRIEGQTIEVTMDHINESQYRKFNMEGKGNISLKFTHDHDVDSPEPAWRIKLQDQKSGPEGKPLFSTDSYLPDEGVACSTELDIGTYYLLVEGLKDMTKKPPTPLAWRINYSLTLSQNNLNVQLLRADKQMNNTYSTIAAAYVEATHGYTIKSTCATIEGNVALNRNVAVAIEGGQDSCFNKPDGYTIIDGLFTVSNGSVRVKGLKVRGQS